MASYHITSSVLVAASSYALTDLATVHDELRIPTSTTVDDAFLTRAIAQVSDAIHKYCNRTFVAETVQDIITPIRDPYPYVVPGGVDPLQLSRFPIIAMQTVKVVEQPGLETYMRAGKHYRTDAKRGQLIRLDPYTEYPALWWPMTTYVTYQAGYATIPPDLVDMVLRLITARYYNRGRDPTLKSQTQPGLGDQSFWVGSVPGVSGRFPEDIKAGLEDYRVPVTA